MTLNYIYNRITQFMTDIQNINFYEIGSSDIMWVNQKKLDSAYRQIDEFRTEIGGKIIKEEQRGRRYTND